MHSRRMPLVLAAAALLPLAPAHAEPGVPFVLAVGASNTNDLSAPAHVKVLQGGRLWFTNLDNDVHDLQSAEANEVFGAPPLAQGESAEVSGVSSLGPGFHQFYCVLHESMRGTIEIVVPPA